ncbi:MAG TPA: peptidoglycan binding domain-containing protein [Chloroflexia bacterium]|nr:peptidoglycan binding domain-containing protein [Chloroflexia bacterium]
MNHFETAHAEPRQPVIAHLQPPEKVDIRKRRWTRRRDEHGEHGHSHGPLRAIFIALAALIVALFALYLGYNAAHDGRVYKGVSVLGADLGGMDRAEARAAIEKASTGYPSEKITVSGAGRTWTLAPADLGLSVDADKTLDTAMSSGRSGGFFDSLGVLFGGAKVAPALKYDKAMLDGAVARIASDVDRPAVDSKLDRDADGKAIITASSAGSLLDRAAARTALEASVAAQPFKPVSVSMRDDSPKVTEAALKASEEQALVITGQSIDLQAGKRAWTIEAQELREMLALTPVEAGKWDVTLDEKALEAYLVPVAEKLRIEPEDAAVILGKDKVTLKEEEAGQELDVPAAIAAIRQASLAGEDARTVDLPIKVIPAAVHTEQVQALYEKTNALVTKGIRLWYGEDGYILRNASVIGFIDVAPAQGGPGEPKLVVDEDVLTNRIAGVALNFNRSPSDARFRMVGGSPKRVATGRDGLKVDVAKSLGVALKAIEGYKGGDRLQVELVVNVTEPKVKNADIASINTPDLLGKGQTSFQGSSPERAWNVTLGAKNIDGALIPPDGVFSTVDAVGDLTLDAGFKMGYMIVNTGEGITTVPAEAGGICQVATTLFHAAFWSGLQMVERNWHSYWISSYGVAPSGLKGLDATIAPPEKDFRFKNNTGNWLLLRATAEKGILTFKIYGVSTGWKVTASDPVITNIVKTDRTPITEETDKLPEGKKVLVEHAQDGFSSSITRTVKDSDGKVIDTWVAKSRYAPAHDRTLVGTGPTE